jgi:hypothetical protein
MQRVIEPKLNKPSLQDQGHYPKRAAQTVLDNKPTLTLVGFASLAIEPLKLDLLLKSMCAQRITRRGWSDAAGTTAIPASEPL